MPILLIIKKYIYAYSFDYQKKKIMPIQLIIIIMPIQRKLLHSFTYVEAHNHVLKQVFMDVV